MTDRTSHRPAELIPLEAVVVPLAIGSDGRERLVALNRLSRRNSKRFPWRTFVPDFVTADRCGRPHAALRQGHSWRRGIPAARRETAAAGSRVRIAVDGAVERTPRRTAVLPRPRC